IVDETYESERFTCLAKPGERREESSRSAARLGPRAQGAFRTDRRRRSRGDVAWVRAARQRSSSGLDEERGEVNSAGFVDFIEDAGQTSSLVRANPRCELRIQDVAWIPRRRCCPASCEVVGEAFEHRASSFGRHERTERRRLDDVTRPARERAREA